MKSIEDFVIVIDKDGTRVPYRDGDSKEGLEFIQVKKGTEIPEKYLKEICEKNLHLVAGVEFKDMIPINLPEGIGISKPVLTEFKVKKRKYSQESLTKIYNEKGFSALKEIGTEFGVKENSYKKLIPEILRIQEERQRAGL